MGFYNDLDGEEEVLVEKDPLTQRDIDEDPLVLEYLQMGTLQGDLGAKERDRVLQQAKHFRWEGTQVVRIWSDGRGERTHHTLRARSTHIWSPHLGGQGWNDLEGPCAPCHLPNIDGTIDPSLSVVKAGLKCMLCGSAKGASTMLVCDRCSKGWHMACLNPPLEVVPQWQCLCPQFM